MARSHDISISIIVATRGRIDCLERLLESLCRVEGRNEIDHEIIIANNSVDESVAREVDDLVGRFSQQAGSLRMVRENRKGKAFATNSAIAAAAGEIVAFLDDDVTVAPDWLPAIADFFTQHPFAAMQGTILLPPEAERDPNVQRVYQRYRTICLFPARPAVKEIKTLTGANMAIRQETLARVGLFDTRLGPGQSGTSDDTELAERILRAGERIACAPRAVVYHDVDWSRLTEDYFRFRHQQQGRSRLIYKQTSFPSIVTDLLRSMTAFIWYSIRNNERKKYRAKGRCFHYGAMLREKTQWLSQNRPGQPLTAGPPPHAPKDFPGLDRENS
jgi:cellulose synthase/poly-beta-1,6-N-acetylglucosamine synthase-like glycosyltransferase